MLPLLLVLLGFSVAGTTVTVAVPSPPHVRIARALQLPIAAHALRRHGAVETDVRVTIDAGRRHHLPPAEVVLMLHDYVRFVRVYGPSPGFGPFIVARLDEGFRGPTLARAIRARQAWHPSGNAYGWDEHGPDDAKHAGKHDGTSHGDTRYASRGSSKGVSKGHAKAPRSASKGGGSSKSKGHSKHGKGK